MPKIPSQILLLYDVLLVQLLAELFTETTTLQRIVMISVPMA